MFLSWRSGKGLAAIAREMRVSEATAEIYVIDCVAQGQGDEDLHQRLLDDLGIKKEKFDIIAGHLKTSDVTLRQIRDQTTCRYNEIRAVIAVMINGVFL